MSLREIKSIVERMEKTESASIVTRRELETVMYKIRRIKERLPKSCPNWIGQELEALDQHIIEVSRP